MKHIILLIFPLISITNLTYAQTIISTSGTTFTNNKTIIDYTLGETTILTFSNNTTDITQGFHQTSLKVLPVIDIKPDFFIDVYPNPTSEFIFIESNKPTKDYHLEIYDTDGRLIIRKKMNEISTTVNVSQYATAIYFLRILNAHDNRVKVYKIIKTT